MLITPWTLHRHKQRDGKIRKYLNVFYQFSIKKCNIVWKLMRKLILMCVICKGWISKKYKKSNEGESKKNLQLTTHYKIGDTYWMCILVEETYEKCFQCKCSRISRKWHIGRKHERHVFLSNKKKTWEQTNGAIILFSIYNNSLLSFQEKKTLVDHTNLIIVGR